MSLYRSHPAIYYWLQDVTDDFSHNYDALLGQWLLHKGLPWAVGLAVAAFLIAVFCDFLDTY